MNKIVNIINRFLGSGKYGYLAKNSLFFMISSFGSKLLSFFLVPLYTNALSTAEMGTADIITTTSSLLLYAVTLCVGDGIFVFAMDKAYKKGPVLKFGISFIAKGILWFSVVLLFFAWWNPLQWPVYLYMFLWFHLSINAFTSVIISYLRATDKIKETAFSGLITSAVTIICGIIFLHIVHLGLIGYCVSVTAGLGAGLAYLLFCCEGFVSIIKESGCDKKTKTAILKYSIPLIINGVSWWINSSIDRYFIIAMAGVEANGIYGVASKIPLILSALSTIFTQAWSVSAIKEFDKEDQDGFFGKAYTGYNCVLLISSSVLILINVPLAKVLFAKEFFSAWRSSSWLIISVLFNSMAAFVGSVFGAVKNSKAFAISTFGAAGINVILNIILIPIYHEMGAALATACSFFTMWLFRYCISRRFIHWKIKIFRDLVAYAVVSVQVVLGLRENHSYLFQIICLLVLIMLYWEYGTGIVKSFKYKKPI